VMLESRVVRCVHCDEDVASCWSHLYLLNYRQNSFPAFRKHGMKICEPGR
jgi:hypothetical protein